jgi:hypothetical protein
MQLVHLVRSALDFSPGGQNEQSAASSCFVASSSSYKLYFPDSHNWQFRAPELFAIFPASHTWQSLSTMEFVFLEYLPATHSLQTMDPRSSA